jgi:hypothetical protein
VGALPQDEHDDDEAGRGRCQAAPDLRITRSIITCPLMLYALPGHAAPPRLVELGRRLLGGL